MLNVLLAVTKALEGLLSRATSLHLKIDMHYRLIKFLAICHLRPGFCHHDVQFVQKKLLEQLYNFSDLINTLGQAHYNGNLPGANNWNLQHLPDFYHHLHSLMNLISFVTALHETFPEAEGLIRQLAIHLSSDEVLLRIESDADMVGQVRAVVDELYRVINCY